MPATYVTLYSDIADRLGQDITDANVLARIKRYINQRYLHVCSIHNWPFLKTHGQILTAAEYATDTCSVTNNLAVVNSFSATTGYYQGYKFKTTGYEEIYRVVWSSIAGHMLILNKVYNGDTDTAAAYTVFKDEYYCGLDWKNILSIRQYNSPAKLEPVSLEDFRALYTANEPVSADPTHYCFLNVKEMTRLNIDGVTGTFAVDELVSQSSSIQGTIKKVASDHLYLVDVYGTFTNNSTITGATSAATALVNEADGYTVNSLSIPKIMLYPAPYQQIMLDCDVIKRPVELSATDDEPLLPEEYKDILVYGGCADLAVHLNNKNWIAYFEQKYQRRIAEMADDLIVKEKGYPYVRTANKRRKY
jgi:hypothetical protein